MGFQSLRRASGLSAALAGVALVLAPAPGHAYQIVRDISQPEQRDANGVLTVEAAVIHVVACNSPGEKGGQFYIYQYLNRPKDRPGFRAILPPYWSKALGGRDFASFGEAVAIACGSGLGVSRGSDTGITGTPISWSTTAEALHGVHPQRFTLACPPNGSPPTPPNGVVGTTYYAASSVICAAAVHAGRITFASGGKVTIQMTGYQPSYVGSARNGVTSVSYPSFTFESFAVL